VKHTYAFLAGQLPGGVGLMLGCCGIPAHWAGQKELFQQIVQDFKMEIKRLGNPTVITACSSCLSIFKEFAGELEATSLWEVLDGLELPASSQNKQKPATPLTLHDPCTARHQQGMQASVRSLCTKLGLNVVEHAFNGELTDCCGYGGLMQMANQPLGRKAAVVKAERCTHDGLAYCAMCRDNLAATGNPVAHLLDYLFPATEGGSPLTRPNPGFSQRHENRARLKHDLLTTLWQEATDPVPEYKKIRLILNQEVLDLLNSRRVLEDDLQKVIHQAEVSGKYLINPDNKHRLAAFKPVRVTYWVEYEPTDQGYLIHTGYSHRMHLPEDHQ
jgi:glutamate synthase (NADPH/NADH) small chain